MCGAESGCAWPLLMPQNPQTLSPMLTGKRKTVIPVLISILAGCATMAVSVWLMPFYAMARAETLGWRLMLVANMTPSIPAWSTETVGILLLFFSWFVPFCFLCGSRYFCCRACASIR